MKIRIPDKLTHTWAGKRGNQLVQVTLLLFSHVLCRFERKFEGKYFLQYFGLLLYFSKADEEEYSNEENEPLSPLYI